MRAGSAGLPGLWRWCPATRTAVTLVVITLAGQAAGVAVPAWRPWILAASVPLLDALGAAYGVRAARRSAQPLSWWLFAAGRACSVLTTVTLMIGVGTGDQVWWWAGTLARLLMFALLAASVLVQVSTFRGRHRKAFVAELCIVLAGGLMPVWYFMLGPVFHADEPSRLWVAAIGYPLGDLLLLVAISAVLLRHHNGTRPSNAGTVLTAGLALYLVADATWSTIGVGGDLAAESAFACLIMVLACLLMTLGPMLAVTGGAGGTERAEQGEGTGWPIHLPVLALGAGGLLMISVSVHDDSFYPWGGLVLASIAMKAAIAVRQHVFVRESRQLLVSDPLTGLTNRTGLSTAMERADQLGEPTAMLLLDLDGFKQVNDVYGHAAGDTMLVHFAGHLRSSVRTADVPARIGGDEFAVLLSDVTTISDAIAVATRIIAASRAEPMHIDGDTFPVRCSIGIALSTPGTRPKETLRQADLAMYEAKRTGTHGYKVYDPAMIDRRVDDAQFAEDLAVALEQGQIHVVYQPIVDLTTRHPIAAEALVRWDHPRRGPVAPDRFIAVAERIGVIDALGLHVLETACRQLSRWREEQPEAALDYIAVNLSPRQLQHPTLVPDILAVLGRTGVEPAALVLEVTESAIVDPDVGIPALRALHAHGIRIAIDDFGTGYSSLRYLTRLPVDIVKIDRAFVAELDRTPAGSAIADAVLRLSEVLGFTTVAEGVETEDQSAELLSLGCTTGQGYLFSAPIPAADAGTWIRHATGLRIH